MQQQKMAKKCPKVQKSIKKAGFYSIGATIRTRRESWVLANKDLFFNINWNMFSYYFDFAVCHSCLASEPHLSGTELRINKYDARIGSQEEC